MDLNDRERRLIELLRACYCAEVVIVVERGVLVRAERIREKVLLDRPLAGKLTNTSPSAILGDVEH